MADTFSPWRSPGSSPWDDHWKEFVQETREQVLESLESYRRGLADAPLLRKWGAGVGPVLRDDGGGCGNGRRCGGPTPAACGGNGPGNGPGDGPGNGPGNGDEGRPGSCASTRAPTRAAAKAGAETSMTFVISTEEVDRHGDVVLAPGWKLDAYLQNPVFLWAHDYSRPVIGRARAVWPEPGQLMARMEFAPTEFAREVAALYRSGYQQAVSVGFRPIRYEERRDERTGAFLGIRFLEQELLEVSAVPVPANRHALSRGLDTPVGIADVLAALRSAG